MSPEHRAEGQTLQEEITALEAKIRLIIDDIWQEPAKATLQDGLGSEDAEDPEEERRKFEKPKKPELGKQDEWKVKLLDMI